MRPVIRIYRGKEIELLDEVYDPGEDSFLLVDAALDEICKGEKVLEIGTGSGIVSTFIKDIADVVATDINPAACMNARINGVQAVRADLFSGICGRFDVVIFNPPYLPTSEEERLEGWLNRAFDGGPDGRLVIDSYIEELPRMLKSGGRALMVISTLTDVDVVADRFRQHGFVVETAGEQKVCFEKLVVLKASLPR